MTMLAQDNAWGLTEKEKQTLRLMVRGHDAKSIASSLGLSVHTVNERLRDARRKMTVSSSREAARLLLEKEGAGEGMPPPHSLGDRGIGGDAEHTGMDEREAPVSGARRTNRRFWIITGVLLMTLLLAFLALTPLAQIDTAAPAPASAAASSQTAETARQWLSLVDQDKWDESYKQTGKAFRKMNTPQVWAETSRKMRQSLGKVISRSFAGEENLPAPPYGYQVVKFHTSYANKPDAVETVALNEEDGHWRVVGVTVD
jgi:DNA-binding CsgD family transcriptional regulator